MGELLELGLRFLEMLLLAVIHSYNIWRNPVARPFPMGNLVLRLKSRQMPGRFTPERGPKAAQLFCSMAYRHCLIYASLPHTTIKPLRLTRTDHCMKRKVNLLNLKTKHLL